MAGENENSDPFEGFTTHEADGQPLSTDEGSQQTGASGDDGSSSDQGGSDADDRPSDQEGNEDASEELDGGGVGDGTGADGDEDNTSDEEGDGDHSEGEGSEGEESDDDDAPSPGDGDDGDGEDVDADDKPKKKKNHNSPGKRIAEARRKQGDAERALEAERARNDTLEARLTRVEKGLPADGDGDSGESGEQGSDLTAPDPSKFDYGEVDPKYIEALTDYRMDLREERNRATEKETRQEEAAQQEAVKLQTAMDNTIAVGIDAYDDFDEIVVKAVDDGKLPLSPAMAFMGVNSPVGHHVLHEIAKDLPLARKLVAMPAHEQIAYFGRLAAQYTEDSGNTPKPKKTPQATPPPSGRRGAKGPKKFNASASSFGDFEKNMNAELAKESKEF